jgi:hypothetical protein
MDILLAAHMLSIHLAGGNTSTPVCIYIRVADPEKKKKNCRMFAKNTDCVTDLWKFSTNVPVLLLLLMGDNIFIGEVVWFDYQLKGYPLLWRTSMISRTNSWWSLMR